MALVTLQTIFQDAFPAYAQTHPLPAHVRRAARAIMQCRTAALGGHVQACPDGHVSRVWYNSCRHRGCDRPSSEALCRERQPHFLKRVDWFDELAIRIQPLGFLLDAIRHEVV